MWLIVLFVILFLGHPPCYHQWGCPLLLPYGDLAPGCNNFTIMVSTDEISVHPAVTALVTLVVVVVTIAAFG